MLFKIPLHFIHSLLITHLQPTFHKRNNKIHCMCVSKTVIST